MESNTAIEKEIFDNLIDHINAENYTIEIVKTPLDPEQLMQNNSALLTKSQEIITNCDGDLVKRLYQTTIDYPFCVQSITLPEIENSYLRLEEVKTDEDNIIIGPFNGVTMKSYNPKLQEFLEENQIRYQVLRFQE